jgi:MFS family permease
VKALTVPSFALFFRYANDRETIAREADDSVRSRLSTMFSSLKVRNYRLFATGQLVKLTGVWMQFTAQDWLVLKLSDRPATALGYVTALQFLPLLLLTLYGGKLADRYDKRRLLIAVNAAFAAVALVLGILVATGAVRLWQVFVVAAVAGTINAIETPVRQSFVSELVGSSLLPNALSLSAATFNTARIIGPTIAGLAIGWFDLGPVFLANAVLCVGPLISAIRMRPSELYRPEGRLARGGSILAGLRYTQRRPDLVLPMALVLVVGMMGFNFPVTLALMAGKVFHADAGSFGLLSAALAVGALAGALASSGRRARPSIYIVIVSAVVFGAFEIGFAFTTSFWLAAASLLPTGFFMMYFAQAANQRVQLGTDSEFRGRVVSLYMLLFLGTTPIGAMVVGWVSERFGPRPGIWLGGLASLLAGLVVGIVQLRRAGARIGLHLSPRPHVHVREPATDGAGVIDFRVPAVRAAAR